MSNAVSASKELVVWVGQAAGTGLGIKLGADAYNKRSDAQARRVVQKGVNRKILSAKTKEIQQKTNGIESSELTEAVKIEARKEYRETVVEHIQTDLELGDSCKGALQDVKIAGNYPPGAEEASLYHVKTPGELPGDPPKENGFVLEFKDQHQ